MPGTPTKDTTYEPVPGWAKIPHGLFMREATSVAVDSDDAPVDKASDDSESEPPAHAASKAAASAAAGTRRAITSRRPFTGQPRVSCTIPQRTCPRREK